MIQDAIKTAFRKKNERGWDKWPRMYWAIDLHDVIIPGSYTRSNEGRQLFPGSKEVLQWLTKREDMSIILYTASHGDAIADIIQWLYEEGIEIDYHNGNPECESNELCDFSSKWYFDILLDDKAGFIGNEDWTRIKLCLLEIGEWQKKRSHAE